MSLAFALALAVAQASAEPRLTLDGAPLGDPAAIVSPLGFVRVVGRPATGPGLTFTLHFARLEWPAPGEHPLEAGATRVELNLGAEASGKATPGTLTVERIDVDRVAFAFTWNEEERTRTLEASLPARLHVPVLQTRSVPKFEAPRDRPDREDIVFCAVGNAGTGLPGQRAVAESIASLAATGPLDLVLMLGNNFLPRGLADLTDPRFVRDFVSVYDKRRLDVPFYATLGPADYLGNAVAQSSRGALDPRWSIPDAVFRFELSCRGKRVEFFGADSEYLADVIGRPATRASLRTLLHGAAASTADWKIVFAHDPLISTGSLVQTPREKTLDHRCALQLRDAKVDLLLCAAGGALRLSIPKDGIPLVMSGGGGGPEMGVEPEIVPGTVFAWGGGGFTWFRFDGETLEVSFRAADGRVLYSHVLRKS